MSEPKRGIAILGSTGSIGTQALDVISAYPDIFSVEILTANKSADLLIEQALRFDVNSVVITEESLYDKVFNALNPYDIKVFTGSDSACDLVSGSNIDIVITAMVGFSGLKPTISAIEAGKTIALANKETLVAAGKIVMDLARRYNAPIIPVDSEHSAIFQLLQGERTAPESIILTASGGPFWSKSLDAIANATPDEALAHPKWNMGKKISIDSATMMNKGLEMIEACWLFDIKPRNISIAIHPQSIIHSMVQFADGSVTAQMSIPDMRLPIQYALSYPFRLKSDMKRIDFSEIGSFDFFPPDMERFPAIKLAYRAIETGGNMPCAMNAANEVAVNSFLNNEITFSSIMKVVEEAMMSVKHIKDPTLEDIYETDRTSRSIATETITKLNRKQY